MKPVDVLDKRLLERGARNNAEVRASAAKALAGLPDLADSVVAPPAEDVEKLRTDLASEHEARAERIVRFVEEANAPPPPRPPVTPINEAEL